MSTDKSLTPMDMSQSIQANYQRLDLKQTTKIYIFTVPKAGKSDKYHVVDRVDIS